MKPTVLDLFSGCGGLSYGFSQAGFEVIGFVEWWQPAITTFLANHPPAQHLGTDIVNVPDGVLEGFKGKIDIIVGGPPCQGFSLCGNRNPKDTRNQLYREYLRFVRIIRPHLFVLENVPGLLSMKDHDNERIIHKIVQDFMRLGYFVNYKVLLASDYGVPQNRKRLVVIGQKLSLFPEPNSTKVSALEALLDLPNSENELNGHVFFKTKPSTLKKIHSLQPGGKLSENFNFSRQRLHPDKPSKTITTKNTFVHPVNDRFLTPRELARLQSFPDSFQFTGSKSSMIKQIGNAVPPLLAQAIAEQIMISLQQNGGTTK
jgi:DNA (cytosine-5)-methyltransferase 1